MAPPIYQLRILLEEFVAASTDDELRAFDARVRRGLGLAPAPDAAPDLRYVAELKIDGLAVSLRYERGRLVLSRPDRRVDLIGDQVEEARSAAPRAADENPLGVDERHDGAERARDGERDRVTPAPVGG